MQRDWIDTPDARAVLLPWLRKREAHRQVPHPAPPALPPGTLGFVVAPKPEGWVGCAAHWPCVPDADDPDRDIAFILYGPDEPGTVPFLTDLPRLPKLPKDDLPF